MAKSRSSNIWNPWVGDSAQEEALDLTVKKERSEENENNLKQFNFQQFYQTYSKISERENKTNKSYNNIFPPQTENIWKRKLPEGFDAPVEKQMCNGLGIEQFKEDKLELENITSRKKVTKTENNLKKPKKKISVRISKIKETCDCKFCYEDHIIRMRLKITHPYL